MNPVFLFAFTVAVIRRCSFKKDLLIFWSKYLKNVCEGDLSRTLTGNSVKMEKRQVFYQKYLKGSLL